VDLYVCTNVSEEHTGTVFRDEVQSNKHRYYICVSVCYAVLRKDRNKPLRRSKSSWEKNVKINLQEVRCICVCAVEHGTRNAIKYEQKYVLLFKNIYSGPFLKEDTMPWVVVKHMD
jgi:hypothetical protein